MAFLPGGESNLSTRRYGHHGIILVVSEQSPIKSFADFNKSAQANPGKFSQSGSGQKSANHAAHERFNAAFGVKTIYALFKGTPPLTRLYTECAQRLRLGLGKK